MMQNSPIRVLVADDSALMRTVITRILREAPSIEVIATARDGQDAVEKAVSLKPDVITMDINMPKLDGITAMQMIVAEKICPVIMFSSLTQRGALETFECLELGAFDFVPKPEGTVSANLDQIAKELIGKIQAASTAGLTKRRIKPRFAQRAPSAPVTQAAAIPDDQLHAVAMGISTGGPATISTVLPFLPPDLPAAVFLVQHMPAAFIGTFVDRLNRECQLRVVQAKAGEPVRAGCVYVAGNDLHLTVFRKLNGEVVLRTPSMPKTLFVPSVNVMMESVLSVYGKRTIGVLMTGIGDDGADQMVAIRQAGGTTVAESQESCVVFGMPYQAIQRGGADFVLPSWEIAEKVVRTLDDKTRKAAQLQRIRA